LKSIGPNLSSPNVNDVPIKHGEIFEVEENVIDGFYKLIDDRGYINNTTSGIKIKIGYYNKAGVSMFEGDTPFASSSGNMYCGKHFGSLLIDSDGNKIKYELNYI
jgi:hypothetical protein